MIELEEAPESTKTDSGDFRVYHLHCECSPDPDIALCGHKSTGPAVTWLFLIATGAGICVVCSDLDKTHECRS